MNRVFKEKVITLALVSIVIGLGPLAHVKSSISDDIKNLERKVEYLKLRKALNKSLKIAQYKVKNIQNKLKQLEKEYQDVAALKLSNQSQTSEKIKKTEREANEIKETAKSTSEPSERRLNNDELKTLVSGVSLEGETKKAGLPYKMVFSSDGSVEVAIEAASTLGAYQDEGKWWIEDNLFCTKFSAAVYFGSKECLVVYAVGQNNYKTSSELDDTIMEWQKIGEQAYRTNLWVEKY